MLQDVCVRAGTRKVLGLSLEPQIGRGVEDGGEADSTRVTKHLWLIEVTVHTDVH